MLSRKGARQVTKVMQRHTRPAGCAVPMPGVSFSPLTNYENVLKVENYIVLIYMLNDKNVLQYYSFSGRKHVYLSVF